MNFVQYLVTNEKMKLYSEMHSYGNNNLAQVYFHPQLPCATACYYFPIHISILLLHISSLYFPRIINDIRIRSPSFCILNNITNNIRPPYSIILLPIYHLFHNFFKFSIIYLNRKLAKIKKKTLKFYKTKEKFISIPAFILNYQFPLHIEKRPLYIYHLKATLCSQTNSRNSRNDKVQKVGHDRSDVAETFYSRERVPSLCAIAISYSTSVLDETAIGCCR